MADASSDSPSKHEKLESDVEGLKLKEEAADTDMEMDEIPVKMERSAPLNDNAIPGVGTPIKSGKRQSRSPTKAESIPQSPAVKTEGVDTVTMGGDVELKLEPGKPPILARKKSTKVERRPPQLFFDYENKTPEATSAFSVLTECVYANKYLGTTEHALECDCAEEWGKSQTFM